METIIQIIATVVILAAFYAGYVIGRKRKETQERLERETIDRFEHLAGYLEPKDYSMDFKLLNEAIEINSNKELLQELKEYISNEFEMLNPKKDIEGSTRAFYE